MPLRAWNAQPQTMGIGTDCVNIQNCHYAIHNSLVGDSVFGLISRCRNRASTAVVRPGPDAQRRGISYFGMAGLGRLEAARILSCSPETDHSSRSGPAPYIEIGRLPRPSVDGRQLPVIARVQAARGRQQCDVTPSHPLLRAAAASAGSADH